MIVLRESILEKEGPLQVSKWIKLPLLIDEREMEALFVYLRESVAPFLLYFVQGLSQNEEATLSPSCFLKKYTEYISCLKGGEVPLLEDFRKVFSCALSVEPKAFYAISVGETKRLIKPCLPVVQMQMNQIRYSPEKGCFRSQVFGSDSITWGIQLS